MAEAQNQKQILGFHSTAPQTLTHAIVLIYSLTHAIFLIYPLTHAIHKLTITLFSPTHHPLSHSLFPLFTLHTHNNKRGNPKAKQHTLPLHATILSLFSFSVHTSFSFLFQYPHFLQRRNLPITHSQT